MENLEHRTPLIDLDNIIKSKDPKLYKRLPRFIIRYLKKIIHQEELNKFILENNKYTGIEFSRNILKDFEISTEYKHKENLKSGEKYIFAANHPVGSMDGIALINTIYDIYGGIKAVVNDILMSVKNLHPFFIGVNKHGSNARDSVIELQNIFASEQPVLFFPAGLASRRIKGKIRDLDWRPTFVKQAVKFKRDVIPVHISGRLSRKFYNISSIRKFLGIKANIEMLYLVDEMVKQSGKKLTITFGKQIPYTTFTKDKTPHEWAQEVKCHIYKIPENPEIEFES